MYVSERMLLIVYIYGVHLNMNQQTLLMSLHTCPAMIEKPLNGVIVIRMNIIVYISRLF